MKTVKDLMNELGVSDQTIRNEAKNQNIAQIKKGKFFYFGDEDAEHIKTAILDRQNNKEARKKTTKHDQQSKYVNFLLDEIKSKDEQIKLLQEEKVFLSKQLADVTESLKAEQASMRNVTESLKAAQVTAQTATLRIAQHDERSWWQRLFGIRPKTDTGSQQGDM